MSKEAGLNQKGKEAKVPTRGRNGTDSQGEQKGRELRNDATCTGAGGICQRTTYICQGRYLEDRCAGPKARQCCMQEFCVKILNVRPYSYVGSVSRGQPLGYLLPLQERFSGITSHLRLQMCDRSDPTPFI
ncbi:hypothetical protein SKAU_G00266290 [Synaphobranchus kaupii]|uniref:Uncharacterized protein n=1 Tax=Synaphobranchus kaupii TaxID=118154 RepID=A0A9Q1EZD1_SYNKA|nr:hypothetical protein SKAU_G00266290 [Synaphobranchus kaupii]